jgi:hypothetical protein
MARPRAYPDCRADESNRNLLEEEKAMQHFGIHDLNKSLLRRHLAVAGVILALSLGACATDPSEPPLDGIEDLGVEIDEDGAIRAEGSDESGPITTLSGCTVPPCGDIYNYTDTWWNISRQDCDGCGWIYSSIGPGQHKGGYWNDGIDWDRFAVPYRCSINGTKNGTSYVWSNYTISPQKWISFSSNETVKLNSYTCQGI